MGNKHWVFDKRLVDVVLINMHMGSETKLRGKNVRSWCDGMSDRSFMVDPLSYFSFQPCSTTGVTKVVVCATCLGWCI